MDIVDVIDRTLVLHCLAVQSGLHAQIEVVQTRDDGWTERTEIVARLRSQPLQIVCLPVAFAQVIAGGYAEYVPGRLLRGNLARCPADDDHELAFEVQIGGIRGVHDVGFGTGDRCR